MMFLDVGDEFLADVAAQVPGFGGIGRGGEHADLHGFFGGVGHLQIPKAFVPKRIGSMISFSALRISSSGSE